jgi:hypothetical protein
MSWILQLCFGLWFTGFFMPLLSFSDDVQRLVYIALYISATATCYLLIFGIPLASLRTGSVKTEINNSIDG